MGTFTNRYWRPIGPNLGPKPPGPMGGVPKVTQTSVCRRRRLTPCILQGGRMIGTLRPDVFSQIRSAVCARSPMTKQGRLLHARAYVSLHMVVQDTIDFLNKSTNSMLCHTLSTFRPTAPTAQSSKIGQTFRGGDLVFRGGRLLELMHFGIKPLGEWWSGWIYRAWHKNQYVFCSAAFGNTYTYVFSCSAATA